MRLFISGKKSVRGTWKLCNKTVTKAASKTATRILHHESQCSLQPIQEFQHWRTQLRSIRKRIQKRRLKRRLESYIMNPSVHYNQYKNSNTWRTQLRSIRKRIQKRRLKRRLESYIMNPSVHYNQYKNSNTWRTQLRSIRKRIFTQSPWPAQQGPTCHVRGHFRRAC